jgi:hypothetical protein
MSPTPSLCKALCVAIDLDEHFVTASEADRDELLHIFESTEEHVGLIYTSHGPAEGLIEAAAKAHMPVPDMFLADSGTTAMKGDGSGTIEPLQRNIMQLWPGKENMQKVLSAFPGLKLLDDAAPCRQMVEIADEETLQAVREKIESMGCSVELRTGKQYDVLPYGVNKGASLGRWIVQENVAPSSFIALSSAAGDLALCGRGWRAAMFASSPDSLKEQCERFHNVRLLKSDGPRGVIEALRYFGFLEVAEAAQQ